MPKSPDETKIKAIADNFNPEKIKRPLKSEKELALEEETFQRIFGTGSLKNGERKVARSGAQSELGEGRFKQVDCRAKLSSMNKNEINEIKEEFNNEYKEIDEIVNWNQKKENIDSRDIIELRTEKSNLLLNDKGENDNFLNATKLLDKTTTLEDSCLVKSETTNNFNILDKTDENLKLEELEKDKDFTKQHITKAQTNQESAKAETGSKTSSDVDVAKKNLMSKYLLYKRPIDEPNQKKDEKTKSADKSSSILDTYQNKTKIINNSHTKTIITTFDSLKNNNSLLISINDKDKSYSKIQLDFINSKKEQIENKNDKKIKTIKQSYLTDSEKENLYLLMGFIIKNHNKAREIPLFSVEYFFGNHKMLY